MKKDLKTFLVVNPHSSGARTEKAWPSILAELKKVLREFQFSFTERSGQAIELTRAALKDGYEMIVSVGGDGTNNEVVNGFFENGQMINPQALFGIICSGTGSDFIKTAGVPRDFRHSVKHLAGQNFKLIDLGWMRHKDHSGKMTERYFINIASFGVGGAADAIVNKSSKPLGGKVAFLMATARAGLFFKNQSVTITLDKKTVLERKIFNLAIANGKFFGAGMMVAPMAEIDDGILEVVSLGDLSFMERLKLSTAIRTGAHIYMPKIEHWRAKEVLAESPENVLLDVDGEQPGTLPAEFKLLHKALRFKIPG